jgi:hypothetical protein
MGWTGLCLERTFDDFAVMCAELEKSNVTCYVEGLFRLLGSDCATEGGETWKISQRDYARRIVGRSCKTSGVWQLLT